MKKCKKDGNKCSTKNKNCAFYYSGGCVLVLKTSLKEAKMAIFGGN